ncbi:MAG: hypothetical protein M0C28_32215 [Candidatus Moduliflexus flocculans]|nr:hypothetical protein [Candidatus Moduliflexus flocculans]
MIMIAYYVITALLLFLAGVELRPREGTPPGRRPLPSRHDPPPPQAPAVEVRGAP